MNTRALQLGLFSAFLGVLVYSSIAKAEAQLIVAEPFNYTLSSTNPDPDGGGTINGGNGLPATNVGGNPAGTSVGLRGNYGTMHTVVEGLTYSNSGGTLVTSANALKRTDGSSYGTEAWIYRSMTTDPFNDYRATWSSNWLGFRTGRSNELYFSMLINANAVNTTTYNRFVMYIGFNGGSNYATFIGQPNGTSKWVYADQAGVSKDLGTATANKTEFIVGKLSYPNATSYSLALWFNPTLGQALGTPTVTQGYPIDDATWTNGADFRGITTRDGVNILTYDEFRMGLTAADVMPVVAATIDNFKNISDIGVVATTDVTVKSGGTLTVNAARTMDELTLEAGSKLQVNSALSTGKVKILAGKDGSTSSLKLDNSITPQSVELIKTLDPTQWHFMSFPTAVTVSEITKADGSSLGTLGTDWFIKYYDGQKRANDANTNGSNWVNFTGTTLEANKGYIFTLKIGSPDTDVKFPLNSAALATQTAKNIAVQANTGTAAVSNHGWNLVGNPFLSNFTANSAEGTFDLYMPNANGTYTAYSKASSPDLKPFGAYFVQAGSALVSSGIGFPIAGRQLAPSSSASQEMETIEVKLTINGKEDRLLLRLRDDFTAQYEIGSDFAKWLVTSAGQPQAYTRIGDVDYAFNALSKDLVNQLQLGYYSPEAITAAWSVSSKDAASVENLFLTDHLTGQTIDLLQGDYSFEAVKELNNNRFTLSTQRIASDVPGAIVQKAIYEVNGSSLRISNLIPGSKLAYYTLTGELIYSGVSTATSIELPVSPATVGILKVSNNNQVQTLKIIH